ncbi:MAG: RNA-directed DNA polymerase, partial [Proteobacteria bacterium]|nr:RNA-directed DNA polymerase [Pseudomonadota bacterium]
RRAVGEAFAENSHSLPPGARESAAAPLQGRGELVDVLRDIIYSAGGGKNLPIGNLCSQWMGNLYLNELDRFVKNDLGVRDYVRYSDDFCLFSNDKAQLREWRAQIREFLDSHLGLEFSKSEIFPVANGLDFVGYRHFGDFVLLRKRTAKRIRARLQRIGGMREIPAAAAGKIRGQVASAYGWMKFACSYNMRKSVQFVKLKNMVGIEQHSH